MSQPVSRAAALAVLFIVLWVGWSSLGAPLLGRIFATSESNIRAGQTLAHYQALAADLPALRKEFDAAALSVDDSNFLPVGSPAMTSARMQGNVQRLIANSGATLHSSRTLTEHQDNGFLNFGLEVEIWASLTDVRNLLVAVETSRPFIRIEKLSIRVPENAAVPMDADGQPIYSLHLQLVSFAQPPLAAGR